METSISSDLDADPIRPQEARYWQAMQDALDRLIYIAPTQAPVAQSGYLYTSFSYATAQLAWDARLEREFVVSRADAMWSNEIPFGSSDFISSVVYPGAARFDFSSYDGVVSGGKYSVWKQNESDISLDFSITPWDGSARVESVSAGTSGAFSPVTWVAAELNTTSYTDIQVAIDTAEPSTVPFSPDGVARFYIQSATPYIDLTSILTDQA